MSIAALPVTESLDRAPTVTVPIASLHRSDSPRIEGENAEYVKTLAEIEGETPPIVVHRQTMRVIDGMHRVRAAILRGRDTIEVRFFNGDEHDAFVLSVELNSSNGLPLSQRDRTMAASRVVATHPHWSDRVIAQVTGLSAKTVAAIRRRSTGEIPQLNGRLGRDGKVRPLNAVHGRQLAGRLMVERPNASLREIAREAGVSVGTAQDVRRRLHQGEDPVPPGQRRVERAGEQPAEKPETNWDPEATRLLPLLKNDPSLRFSEVGRTVLRLLDVHSIPPEGWAQLVDAVPVHCAEVVAGVARSCAKSWLHFADEVEKRGEKLC